jgi:hypothetical protein
VKELIKPNSGKTLLFWTVVEVFFATTLILSQVGYRAGGNPTQYFLQPVLSESGILQNNWQSSIQPQTFWFLTHLFAIIPNSLLESSLFIFYFIQILIIVVSFKSILLKYEIPFNLRILGYILIAHTQLKGLGTTSGIMGFFYPTNLAFSMTCLLVSAIISKNSFLIGISAGCVSLCNPSSGLLVFIIFIIPTAIAEIKSREKLFSIIIPFIVLSIIPIYLATSRNQVSLDISQESRINLRLISRMPHHYNYQEFPSQEYINIIFWILCLFFTQKIIEVNQQIVIVRISLFILLSLMAVSGVASVARDWFFLIELRPLRISPIIPFLGTIALLILVSKLRAKYTNTIFLAILVSVGIFKVVFKQDDDSLVSKFIRSHDMFSYIVALSTLALIYFLVSKNFRNGLLKICAPKTPIVFSMILLVLGFLNFFHTSKQPLFPKPIDQMYSQIIKNTEPGDIIMIPPNIDSFPYYTKRAVIVEWSTNPFGFGEDEYIQRLIDVVGDKELFDLSKPTRMKVIDAKLATRYQRNLETPMKVLCKYKARYVLSMQPNYQNHFLKAIFTNSAGTFLVLKRNCGLE